MVDGTCIELRALWLAYLEAHWQELTLRDAVALGRDPIAPRDPGKKPLLKESLRSA